MNILKTIKFSLIVMFSMATVPLMGMNRLGGVLGKNAASAASKKAIPGTSSVLSRFLSNDVSNLFARRATNISATDNNPIVSQGTSMSQSQAGSNFVASHNGSSTNSMFSMPTPPFADGATVPARLPSMNCNQGLSDGLDFIMHPEAIKLVKNPMSGAQASMGTQESLLPAFVKKVIKSETSKTSKSMPSNPVAANVEFLKKLQERAEKVAVHTVTATVDVQKQVFQPIEKTKEEKAQEYKQIQEKQAMQDFLAKQMAQRRSFVDEDDEQDAPEQTVQPKKIEPAVVMSSIAQDALVPAVSGQQVASQSVAPQQVVTQVVATQQEATKSTALVVYNPVADVAKQHVSPVRELSYRSVLPTSNVVLAKVAQASMKKNNYVLVENPTVNWRYGRNDNDSHNSDNGNAAKSLTPGAVVAAGAVGAGLVVLNHEEIFNILNTMKKNLKDVFLVLQSPRNTKAIVQLNGVRNGIQQAHAAGYNFVMIPEIFKATSNYSAEDLKRLGLQNLPSDFVEKFSGKYGPVFFDNNSLEGLILALVPQGSEGYQDPIIVAPPTRLEKMLHRLGAIAQSCANFLTLRIGDGQHLTSPHGSSSSSMTSRPCDTARENDTSNSVQNDTLEKMASSSALPPVSPQVVSPTSPSRMNGDDQKELQSLGIAQRFVTRRFGVGILNTIANNMKIDMRHALQAETFRTMFECYNKQFDFVQKYPTNVFMKNIFIQMGETITSSLLTIQENMHNETLMCAKVQTN
ncbi:MAG: hypothetical protein NTX86_05790 [Candidatus Dependentiae bacterium]|nr:hypothetical protein [Candidatus Dependentiae bacterium]